MTSAPPPSVGEYFARRGWSPFAYQRGAWAAYLGRGEGVATGGLIHAPTGVGKSLAAWMGPVIEGLREREAGGQAGGSPPELRSRRGRAAAAEPLRVLWITPMRALAGDSVASLAEPVESLGLPWTVEKRTGDTAQSIKKRQREKLPTALVTTPESLSLLLSYPESRKMFRTLRCVVVDEWHELLSTKRGTQMELGLARLRAWHGPRLWTWGLSATLGNIDQAARTLLGVDAPPARIVRGILPKETVVDTLRPPDIERFPWAGHMGLAVLPEVVRAIDAASSTLLFTNTRSQAEIWYKRLLDAKPEWLGMDAGGKAGLAIHHGSLDRDLRAKVEEMLKTGRLKCVVCTSSLDLGVDFSPVDQVIQVGSPKGVARLLQRAGRSGHRPGAVSLILGVPTHAMELVEFAAVRRAVAAGQMESRVPLDRPLDVLVQHLVTVAAGGGFVEEELRTEVRTTVAFEKLTDAEWDWAMDFVRGGGRALAAYPQYARIRAEGPGGQQASATSGERIEREESLEAAPVHAHVVRGSLRTTGDGPSGCPDRALNPPRYTVASPQIARLHRLAIGTITSDMSLRVAYLSGRTLGTIEESFISRLWPGDRFTFAGRILEFVRLRENVAYVQRTTRKWGIVPRWNGGRFPLSTQLAAGVRGLLDEAREGVYHGPEMELARPLFELQQQWSIIPRPGQLLIEQVRTEGDEGGYHAFLFPFDGRLVQEGLGALLGFRLSKLSPRSVTGTATDYGVELFSDEPIELDEAGWRSLLSPENLVDDLLACLNSTQLARRQFRDIARIAGLVVPGMPGNPRPGRQLQASSNMFFDVFSEFDPENLLLDQARREVLENQLEVVRLREALLRAGSMAITIVRLPDGLLSPFAFPIWAERLRSTHVTSRDWTERIGMMALRLESWANDVPPPVVRVKRRRRAATRSRGSRRARSA